MPEVLRKGTLPDIGKESAKLVAEIQKMVSEGLTGSAWKSITALPKNTAFEAQNEGETLLLLLRSHPITNIWWIGLILILLPIPFFWGEFPFFVGLNPLLMLAIDVLWYLSLVFFGVEQFLVWFYSVFIVTDERIIDVDFFSILSKNVDVTQIHNIEEVNYSQTGLFANLFDYGNVISQTASEQKSLDASINGAAFTFEAVPDPDRVTRVISELMQQEEDEFEGRRK